MLENCPHCNAPVEFDAGNSIHCTECPAQMCFDNDESEDEMAQFWNRRYREGS